MAEESTGPSTRSEAFTQRLAIQPYQEGRLSGLTFAVKDLIDVSGLPTSCGNPDWLETHPPAIANAVCVDQLLDDGATCIGKTITDELAYSLFGENYFFGTPLNPRAPERVPGGSSSGSASAVAQGLCDFALGTDTGGSVRVPASNCGIWGWRPTHGLISVAGVTPLAPTFDTVGVLASRFSVLQEVGRVFFNERADTSSGAPNIYVIREAWDLSDRSIVDALRKHVEALKGVGTVSEMSVREIDGEKTGDMLNWATTYNKVQRAEVWSCFGSWVDSKKPRFGPATAGKFDLAKSESRAEIGEHCKRRELYYRRLQDLLSTTDFICIPTTPLLAPMKGSMPGDYYPRTLSLTSIAGIGRLPEISMPVGTADGVPIGLSLIARTGNDESLFNLVSDVWQTVCDRRQAL